MTTEDIDFIIEKIHSEPVMPNSIWKDLSFWKALKITMWMVIHPYNNARAGAITYRREVVEWLRAHRTGFLKKPKQLDKIITWSMDQIKADASSYGVARNTAFAEFIIYLRKLQTTENK